MTALLGSSLCLTSMVLGPVALAQTQQTTTPAAVPDAPAPQATPPLSDVDGPITPGRGSETTPSTPPEPTFRPGSASPTPAQQQTPPPAQLPASQAKDDVQTVPAEEGAGSLTKIIVNVNFVEVPVTVKDSKGNLVAGLTQRDFKVFENNVRYPLRLFSVDPRALSIAFVIDQSLTADVMAKVNDSLGALQGALTSYDEVAVFKYSNGAQELTGFTGAAGNRLPAVLALAKATGTDEQVPSLDGPLANCSITKNGSCADPNLQQGRSAGGSFMVLPKEIHTLNDAILNAAKELSTRPKGRRRIIYVISDGKEYGSKATYKEVLRYLETNKIAVYGTLVGDSARWGEGYVSRVHLPFSMYDNILARYILATGGEPDAERGLDGIEKSYARIAEEARNQYTLGYYSHQPVIDGKFRKIEVRLERTGMEVVAKQGYYPSAEDMR